MLEGALLVLLGLGVGVFGAIVGAGGGFILVPVLLVAWPDRDPATVTAISLAVVFANAASGAAAYAWQRRIDYRSGAWWALAAIPGVIGGALLVGILPRGVFVVVFAMVSAGVATHLIVGRAFSGYREPISGRGTVSRRLRDRRGQNFIYTFRLRDGLAIAGGMGFVSGLLGAGGGVLQVPLMTIILRFPVHIATATSQFAYALVALEAATAHLATGSLRLEQDLAPAGLIAAGAVAGAQAGARLALRVRGAVILRTLSTALPLVAAWLLLDTFLR